MFDLVCHADWSLNASKRWIAWAQRGSSGWVAVSPRQVLSATNLLMQLLSRATHERILIGLDFPIGVPVAFGRQTGLADFRKALHVFGHHPGWERFFEVGDDPAAISIQRPFYPRRSDAGVSRMSLVQGLGVNSFRELLRSCEKGAPGRREACSLFWTLGGNQVGKAAIAGWQEVIKPALTAGARLWPFDGSLLTLSQTPGLIITETYPADAYAMIGAPLATSESKRRQFDRAAKADAIIRFAASASIDVSLAQSTIREGFGQDGAGEDRFDAFVGLLATIGIVDGLFPEGGSCPQDGRALWEGGILGRV